MTKDRNKNIAEITYNHFNLPKKITIGGAKPGTITYIYSANGEKLKKTVTEGSKTHNTDYLDGFQYKQGRLSFFPTTSSALSAGAEGYANVTYKFSSSGPLLTFYNYVYNYTDHLDNIRLRYTKDPQAETGLKILEENHYYPFGLKHHGYNNEKNIFTHVAPINKVVIVPITPDLSDPYKYKYNGKEFQDELGLDWYDYGARNYDASLGRWMNVDPLADIALNRTPYHFVSNNPINRIDPLGLTDFTLNKTTGKVSQVGDANDEPDRVLKTDKEGNVKRKGEGFLGFLVGKSERGKAKVAFGDIEKGILNDGQNLRTEGNAFEIGREGQPSEQRVEAFALKLSNYVGKEIGGTYFSTNGGESTTHITIGGYENNKFKKTKSHGTGVFRQFVSTAEEFTSSITGFFHTHPSGSGISDRDRLVPSLSDRQIRDNSLKRNPNLNFFLLTHPQYGGKFPRKIPYAKGYPTSDRR